ncbi:MAG: phosphotransferase [Burkholderiaceae bacterium]|nr:phosphotransferase [Roseateles sp.]MBV8468962.1 phosphotransferase [Burkholderiaceae bacterium]
MNPIAWPDPARETHFSSWLSALQQRFELRPETLSLASQDASSRRYLRIERQDGSSLIVMDAPDQVPQMRAFEQVAGLLRDCRLHVPQILASDEARGFMLLEDLGQTTYLQALQQASPAQADRLMRAAITALVAWQAQGDAALLPPYDEAFVRRELDIFSEWCVAREFQQQWNADQQKWWQHCCDLLVKNALSQPQVAMHRDYMPRNLMVCEPLPGILDFQDAVRGPIGYDIASLLRDAFISWDEERELDWAIRYWEAARKAGLPVGDDFGELWRQIEWSGLQRHLKILGIFCRLKHRDQRPHYAQDLPRFFAYAIKVSTRYVELSPLTHLLQALQGGLVQTGFDLR